MEQNTQEVDRDDSIRKPAGGRLIKPANQLKIMRQALKKNLSRQIQFMRNSCVDCGLCADSCHYYCADGDGELIPANKLKKLSGILQTYFHPLRSRLPGFKSSNQPDEQMISDLYQAAYENCTLCGKSANVR
jgi:ferredoxin